MWVGVRVEVMEVWAARAAVVAVAVVGPEVVEVGAMGLGVIEAAVRMPAMAMLTCAAAVLPSHAALVAAVVVVVVGAVVGTSVLCPSFLRPCVRFRSLSCSLRLPRRLPSPAFLVAPPRPWIVRPPRCPLGSGPSSVGGVIVSVLW